MNKILVTRDSKSKIRVVEMTCDWSDALKAYAISRKTGLLGGKMIDQPIIEIKSGKVKRTVTEQAQLQFDSKFKEYLDKGYKEISSFGISSLDDFKEEMFPEQKVDQNNALKPMLAKKFDEVNPEIFKKKFWASRKLDGVRCMIRLDEDETMKTSSRGGGDYDIPATLILRDILRSRFFKKYPELILDGELYKHGWTLQKISGLCRKITLENDHKELEFWVYDIAGTDWPFSKRLEKLKELKLLFEGTKIKICDHIETNSLEEINSLHDKFVNEGYEGCVIRDHDKEYGYGKKDLRMIKCKKFLDEEFEILGINEGLRDEDFSFRMKCEKGEFGAKPMGTREQRQWYRDNINELVGKLATVKYFGLTPDGIPNLPIWKCLRDKTDL